MKRLLILFLAVGMLTQVARADIWDELAKYKMGDAGDQALPVQVHELIVKTPLDQRGPVEDALLKIVTSSASTPEAKWFSCRMLQRVGTEKCVPTLAKLLGDEQLSHYARLTLQRMTDSSSAGAALRAGLDGAPDKLKPGILGSLAERRDQQAVPQIAKLASANNAAVAAGALQALGKIGGPSGKAALENASVPAALQAAKTNALLVYAEGAKDAATFQKIYDGEKTATHRGAALRGLLTADESAATPIVVELLKGDDSYLRRTALRLVAIEPSAKLTAGVSGALAGMDAKQQTELVGLLGERGDGAALSSVVGFLESQDPALRTAAIVSVGLLGGPDNVKPLLAQATVDGYKEKALESIAAMTADGVDAALIAALSDGGVKAPAIQAITVRNVVSAKPEIKKLTVDGDAAVREAAWEGLGVICRADDLDELMKMMLAVEDKGEKKGAQKALKDICSAAGDKNACLDAVGPYFDKPDESVKLFVLEVCGTAGGPKGYSIVKDALKSDNKNLYEKAVRTFAAWPSDRALPDLLELAENGSNNVMQIVSLQGYIRIAGKIGDQRKRVEALKNCQSLVKRVEEKRMLIGELKNSRHPDAFILLAGYLDDAEVVREAQVAAVDLAKQVTKDIPEDVNAAMAKIMNDSGAKKDVAKKARDFYNQTSAQKNKAAGQKNQTAGQKKRGNRKNQ